MGGPTGRDDERAELRRRRAEKSRQRMRQREQLTYRQRIARAQADDEDLAPPEKPRRLR